MPKLKDKKIRAMLMEGTFRVTESPIPSNEDIAAEVAEHNKGYAEATVVIRDGYDRNGWAQRHLPEVYNRGRKTETTSTTPKVNHDWVCPIEDVKGCPVMKEPVVEVPVEMYRAWTELANQFSTEWMAYLIGEMDQSTGRGKITEMYFPPQSASGAHVEMPDEAFRVRPGTVAAVHSHVKMEAFFSSTDRDHANWPIEIVINARGESQMAMRVKLECGRYSRVDGKVMLTGLNEYQGYIDQLKAAMKPEVVDDTELFERYGIGGKYQGGD